MPKSSTRAQTTKPSPSADSSKKPGPRSAKFASIVKPVVPKTGELIASELRRRIMSGELAEGSTLPTETELMAQLGIARPTLREALRILESETLITVRRGSRGGPMINRPDPGVATRYFGLVLQAQGTTLMDVYQARAFVEPSVISAVVKNARSKAPAVLREILKEEQEALAAGDFDRVSHGLAGFHDALVELTGNRSLILLMHMLNVIFEQHIASISITVGPDFDRNASTRQALKSHEKLIALIEQGNTEAAVSHWQTHLASVEKVLFQQFPAGQGSRVIDVVK